MSTFSSGHCDSNLDLLVGSQEVEKILAGEADAPFISKCECELAVLEGRHGKIIDKHLDQDFVGLLDLAVVNEHALDLLERALPRNQFVERSLRILKELLNERCVFPLINRLEYQRNAHLLTLLNLSG